MPAISLFPDPPMVPTRNERTHYEYERHLLDTYADRRDAPRPARKMPAALARAMVFVGLRKSP